MCQDGHANKSVSLERWKRQALDELTFSSGAHVSAGACDYMTLI